MHIRPGYTLPVPDCYTLEAWFGRRQHFESQRGPLVRIFVSQFRYNETALADTMRHSVSIIIVSLPPVSTIDLAYCMYSRSHVVDQAWSQRVLSGKIRCCMRLINQGHPDPNPAESHNMVSIPMLCVPIGLLELTILYVSISPSGTCRLWV